MNDVNDSGRDEELSMGAKALFIENPTDKSNRVNAQQLSPAELPQGDPAKMPYTICGPYLKKLFDRAFVEGLHDRQSVRVLRNGKMPWSRQPIWYSHVRILIVTPSGLYLTTLPSLNARFVASHIMDNCRY